MNTKNEPKNVYKEKDEINAKISRVTTPASRSHKGRIAGGIALSALLAFQTPLTVFAGEYNIAYGDITISGGSNQSVSYYAESGGVQQSASDSNPTVTGSSDANTVTLDASSGDVNVTFENLNISSTNEAPVNATNTTGTNNVTIELNGTNTLTGGTGHAALEDNLGGTLKITDTDNNGSLTANGGDYGAGIGGGGQSGTDIVGSNITIEGGTINATGGDHGAGIGGGVLRIESQNGEDFYGYNVSNITISGGEVTATGGEYAAGIGGGNYGNGQNITISGGEVTATGGRNGAGIGGGADGDGQNITISGGEVTATGGTFGAGIGGGLDGDGKYITISGGEVIATSEGSGAGIGGGLDGELSGITITGPANVYVSGGERVPSETDYGKGAGIGDGGKLSNNDPDIQVDSVSVELDTSGLTTGIVREFPAGTSAQEIKSILNPSTGTGESSDTLNGSDNLSSGNADNTSYGAFQTATVNTLTNYLAAIDAGTLDLATLQREDTTLDAGNWISFRKDTYILIDRLTKRGVSVKIKFVYNGISYEVTIPANTAISTEALCNEEGYCGFLNLIKFFGGNTDRR